jgi:hypothetical protein
MVDISIEALVSAPMSAAEIALINKGAKERIESSPHLVEFITLYKDEVTVLSLMGLIEQYGFDDGLVQADCAVSVPKGLSVAFENLGPETTTRLISYAVRFWMQIVSAAIDTDAELKTQLIETISALKNSTGFSPESVTIVAI